MSNKVVQLRSRRSDREAGLRQAGEWLLRLQAGLDIEERRRFDAWLADRPEHAQMLLEMAGLWDQMDILSELSSIFPLEGFQPKRQRSVAAQGPWRFWLAGGVTAIVAAWVGGAVVWTGLQPQTGASDFAILQTRTYATDVGRQLTVNLPDGSEVILNTDTAIEVQYSAEARSIRLEKGEAHFSVTSRPDWPFRVYAGTRVVEAVGTAFAVQRSSPRHIEVTVSEGGVRLLRMADLRSPVSPSPDTAAGAEDSTSSVSEREPIPLATGEYARIEEESDFVEKTQLRLEEVEARLAWRHGMLFFQGEALEAVLREVNRYSSIRIEAEQSILDVPVIGVFRVDNVDAILAAMRENFGLRTERLSDGRILLTP